MKKEVLEIVEEAIRQGWRAKKLESGHYMLFPPNGDRAVTIGGTPSDRKWRINTIKRMQKSGFQWPPERGR